MNNWMCQNKRKQLLCIGFKSTLPEPTTHRGDLASSLGRFCLNTSSCGSPAKWFFTGPSFPMEDASRGSWVCKAHPSLSGVD